MSYNIVYETKVVNLPDGRILHLDRSGCNNDTQGREKGVFQGTVYTREAFEHYIARFEDGTPYEGFDLRIGSRYCQWADYGRHLRRMLKRAMTWEELTASHAGCCATIFDGVTFYPSNKRKPAVFYDPKEWEEVAYKWLYRYEGWEGSIRRRTHREEDIAKIVDSLEKGATMEIHVGKKKAAKAA